jgi:hypothetical protein
MGRNEPPAMLAGSDLKNVRKNIDTTIYSLGDLAILMRNANLRYLEFLSAMAENF